MSIGAVHDDVLAGYRQDSERTPDIEPRRLTYSERRKNAVVGHRPPAQSQILRRKISKRIEVVPLPTQYSCRHFVVRPRRQPPAAVGERSGGRNVGLTRLGRREPSIGGIKRPLIEALPGTSEDGGEQRNLHYRARVHAGIFNAIGRKRRVRCQFCGPPARFVKSIADASCR